MLYNSSNLALACSQKDSKICMHSMVPTIALKIQVSQEKCKQAQKGYEKSTNETQTCHQHTRNFICNPKNGPTPTHNRQFPQGNDPILSITYLNTHMALILYIYIWNIHRILIEYGKYW